MGIIRSDIKYLVKTTSQLSEDEILEFIEKFNFIFEVNYNKEWFEWKYNNNIYGESYFVFAYENEKLIGSRIFWRNDLLKKKAYQPVDTFILKEYRNKGIFGIMTKLGLEKIEGSLIYNFPNQNSLPGNIKLGWKLKYKYNLHILFNHNKLYENNFITKIEDKYLEWRFLNSPLNKYFYYEKNNSYYLLKKRKYNFYYILGEINKEFITKLNKINKPILLYYSSEESKMKILNNKGNLVVKNFNEEIDFITITKNDTI